MSRHLRLVGSESDKSARRKGERSRLLTTDEEQRFRQAIRNLRIAFGSTAALAAAMDATAGTLINMLARRQRVSGDLVVRAMRASGLSLTELLSGPVSADRCPACGQIKRGRAA